MTLVDTPFTALHRVLDGLDDIDGLLTALDCLTDRRPEISDDEAVRGANAIGRAMARRVSDLRSEADAAFPPEAADHGDVDLDQYLDEVRRAGDLAPLASYVERVAGLQGHAAAVRTVCAAFRGVRPVVWPVDGAGGGDA